MSGLFNLLPSKYFESAFVTKDKKDIAWPKEKAIEVIDFLSTIGLAVLGGEVWQIVNNIVTPINFTLGPYPIPDKKQNESWINYFNKVNSIAKKNILSEK